MGFWWSFALRDQNGDFWARVFGRRCLSCHELETKPIGFEFIVLSENRRASTMTIAKEYTSNSFVGLLTPARITPLASRSSEAQ